MMVAVPNVLLRRAAVAYAVLIAVHVADHLRRGVGASPRSVIALGGLTAVVQAFAIWAVLARRPNAPLLAVAIGLPDAVGIFAVHLLPRWSGLSDAFPGAAAGAGVTWLSWTTAVLELLAAVAFAAAGWAAVRASRAGAVPSGRAA